MHVRVSSEVFVSRLSQIGMDGFWEIHLALQDRRFMGIREFPMEIWSES